MKVVVAAADLHAPIGYAAQPGITLERRDKPGDVLVPFGLRAVLAAILDEKLFHCCAPWLSDDAGGHQSPRAGARAEDRTLKPQDFFRGIPRNAGSQTLRRSLDRKSTRLNSSHLGISYAVFCLK